MYICTNAVTQLNEFASICKSLCDRINFQALRGDVCLNVFVEGSDGHPSSSFWAMVDVTRRTINFTECTALKIVNIMVNNDGFVLEHNFSGFVRAERDGKNQQMTTSTNSLCDLDFYVEQINDSLKKILG